MKIGLFVPYFMSSWLLQKTLHCIHFQPKGPLFERPSDLSSKGLKTWLDFWKAWKQASKVVLWMKSQKKDSPVFDAKVISISLFFCWKWFYNTFQKRNLVHYITAHGRKCNNFQILQEITQPCTILNKRCLRSIDSWTVICFQES